MGLLGKLFNRPPKPGKPQPVGDDNFEAEVMNSDLPVVVDFYSTTCSPCQVMGGLLNELGPQFADRVRIFKLNVNYNPETAQRFGIRSVPTVFFMDHGKVVDRHVGLIPLGPLRDKIEKLASR
jgi:thioredoxin 1